MLKKRKMEQQQYKKINKIKKMKILQKLIDDRRSRITWNNNNNLIKIIKTKTSLKNRRLIDEKRSNKTRFLTKYLKNNNKI